MVTLGSLWLPILLSAVVVFFASFVMHTVLTYHRADVKPLPSEDRVADTLRGTAPGQYLIPYSATVAEMRSPAMQEKFKRGPLAFITLRPAGAMGMGPFLVQWFVYCLVVGVFVAYITSRTVASGAEYLGVFRIAGTVAFLGYAGSEAANAIWRGIPWGNTVRAYIDGLIYGLLTAGVFGWLWPR